MAKKRVHEIAKERGISSKEVLAVLQKAGLNVKAAASSVDEEDIRRAFSNGADGAPAEAPKQETKADDGAAEAAPKRQQQPGQQRQPEQQSRQQRPPRQEGGQRGGGEGAQRGGGDAQREQRPQRPQR